MKKVHRSGHGVALMTAVRFALQRHLTTLECLVCGRSPLSTNNDDTCTSSSACSVIAAAVLRSRLVSAASACENDALYDHQYQPPAAGCARRAVD